MATIDEMTAELRALEKRKVQLIHARRLAQAREYLAKPDLTAEERAQTEKHIADLEAAGYHLPKE